MMKYFTDAVETGINRPDLSMGGLLIRIWRLFANLRARLW
jgi:hypothetical protein